MPDIKFEVIGEVSKFNKFLLSLNKNVECRGMQKNLDKFISLRNRKSKYSNRCARKILTYKAHGLPVVCSKKYIIILITM